MDSNRYTWTPDFWQRWVQSATPSRAYTVSFLTSKAIGLLAPQPGELILNAGCGFGREAASVFESAPEARVVGVDISSEMAKAASEKLGQHHPFSGMQASIESLPFPDGSFDKVLSLGVVMHVNDELAACRELVRVLKPGGHFVVSFNNLAYFLSPVVLAYLRWAKRKRPGFKQSLRLPFYYNRTLNRAGCETKLYPGSFSLGVGGRLPLSLWRSLDRWLGPVCPWATFEPILYCKKPGQS